MAYNTTITTYPLHCFTLSLIWTVLIRAPIFRMAVRRQRSLASLKGPSGYRKDIQPPLPNSAWSGPKKAFQLPLETLCVPENLSCCGRKTVHCQKPYLMALNGEATENPAKRR